MENKNKVLMLILTILFPGLGNLYIGDNKRGVIILAISMVTMALTTWRDFFSMFFIVIYIHAITRCFYVYNNSD